MNDPSTCTNMDQVRAALDALDEEIVTLLGRRMRFVEAAGRIKKDRDKIRDEPRNAAVIAHARAVAEQVGFPPVLAGQIYELLIEGSITHELDWFERH